MKTYSLIINWNDDNDEGTYGATVRAENEVEAERLARLLMWDSAHDGHSPVEDIMNFAGSLIECSEDAIWKAAEMEAVLRDFLQCSKRIHDEYTWEWRDLMVTYHKAEKLIEGIDNG